MRPPVERKQNMNLLAGSHWEPVLGAGAGLIVTLLNGLFGYRLRKLWISVWGALIGFGLGTLVSGWAAEESWIIWTAGIAVALLGALVAYRLYLAGIFLVCALAALSTVLLLWGWNIWWKIVAAVLAGILVGILGVKFVKPMVILSTSISAATAVSHMVLEWLKIPSPAASFLVSAVLAVLFAVFQVKNAHD